LLIQLLFLFIGRLYLPFVVSNFANQVRRAIFTQLLNRTNFYLASLENITVMDLTGLTPYVRSNKGLHTHVNLLNVRPNKGAQRLHHNQLRKVAVETLTSSILDRPIYRANARKAYKEAKKLAKQTFVCRLEVGQILARH